MTESPGEGSLTVPAAPPDIDGLVAFEDPHYRAAVVDLLGAIAYGEISAFERLAEDAKLAPTLEDKVAIATMATAEFGHVGPLRERLVELGEIGRASCRERVL